MANPLIRVALPPVAAGPALEVLGQPQRLVVVPGCGGGLHTGAVLAEEAAAQSRAGPWSHTPPHLPWAADAGQVRCVWAVRGVPLERRTGVRCARSYRPLVKFVGTGGGVGM
ncbi:hypothetical protein EASAB2608_07128 [Streptomyces sp. EAS-AB2608]|nr:hypothetical protein EASAB2608_07128 [Streptomyces sp. EAS-AB2608]